MNRQTIARLQQVRQRQQSELRRRAVCGVVGFLRHRDAEAVRAAQAGAVALAQAKEADPGLERRRLESEAAAQLRRSGWRPLDGDLWKSPGGRVVPFAEARAQQAQARGRETK